ncbi:MAG: 50S ribosomal protein L29 [bacterium]|nr:50S ribosomal protein L29 [bacterium]
MKMSEIRELGPEETEEKERSLRSEIFNLKFRKVTGQLDNTAGIRQVKRDLARLMTLKQEQKAAAPEASKESN